MRYGNVRKVELPFDDGKVKRGTIESDEEGDGKQIVWKIIKIFIFDEEFDYFAVPAGDDRNGSTAINALRFDIEINTAVPAMVQKTPAVFRFEILSEKQPVMLFFRLYIRLCEGI